MLCIAATLPCPVAARLLLVGPARALHVPSQAAAVAQDGDVVRIDPGLYRDCAVWQASGLVIEAAGPGVRIAGKTCEGKGIFVIDGDRTTVRGITFADATVADHNGAGIRLAGDNLTVENSRFLHNENGILAGGSSTSVLLITGSSFIGNGACINACAHGVYAGAPIGRLDIERSEFRDTRIAHHIKSRALETVVRACDVEDGPDGTSSYLIETPDGGNLLIEDNVLEKGPHSSHRGVAISIATESLKNPTRTLVVRNNRFRSGLTTRTIFVRNASTTPALLSGNSLVGNVMPLTGPGNVLSGG